MLTLVTYDISDNKKRTKLAKHLKRYGLRRIQYSGFVGEMNPNDRIILTKEVRQYITPVKEKMKKEARGRKRKKDAPQAASTEAPAQAEGGASGPVSAPAAIPGAPAAAPQTPDDIEPEDGEEVPKADSIYIIPLCERCLRVCKIVSDQELGITETGEVTIVG